MKLYIITLFAVFSLAAPAMASESDTALRATLQRELNAHLAARSKIEHISATGSASFSRYAGAGASKNPVPETSCDLRENSEQSVPLAHDIRALKYSVLHLKYK